MQKISVSVLIFMLSFFLYACGGSGGGTFVGPDANNPPGEDMNVPDMDTLDMPDGPDMDTPDTPPVCDGCLLDEVCYEEGEAHPQEDCTVCDGGDWGVAPDEFTCGEDRACFSGLCRCAAAGFAEADCDQCVVYVSGEEGDDDNDGLRWTSALATVGAGVALANERHTELDASCQVWVEAGTYAEIVMGPFLLYGGFTGIEESVEERDLENLRSTIDPSLIDPPEMYHPALVMNEDLPGRRYVVDGFVVQGGTSPEGGGGFFAMFDVDIRNTTFRENEAEFGSALYVGRSRTVTLTNVRFEENRATRRGAALFVDEGSIVELENVAFVGNETQSDTLATSGGAVYITNATVEFIDVLFQGNSVTGVNRTASGGALFSTGSTITLEDVEFDGNLVNTTGTFAGFGGAYASSEDDTVTMTRVEFRNNAVQSQDHSGTGGALLISGSTVDGLNLIFVDNAVQAGGVGRAGAAMLSQADGSIANALLVGNEADHGGGIAANGSDVHLRNWTVFENTAEVGGGLHLECGVRCPFVHNSIIWGNSASQSGTQVHVEGSPGACIRHSIVEGSEPANVSCWDPAESSGANPLFVSPPEDLRLQAGSPAVDAGSPDTQARHYGNPPRDLDGNPRFADGSGDGISRIDIGAYELQP